MKRASAIALLGISMGMLPMLWSGSTAQAHPQFKKEFDKKYVKKPPTTDQEKMFSEAASKAKCNTCHKGKDKKGRNSYGEALAKLLTKKDRKDVPKINSALVEVEKAHSKTDDPTSPTFGDLIQQGKLPAGEASGAEEHAAAE